MLFLLAYSILLIVKILAIITWGNFWVLAPKMYDIFKCTVKVIKMSWNQRSTYSWGPIPKFCLSAGGYSVKKLFLHRQTYLQVIFSLSHLFTFSLSLSLLFFFFLSPLFSFLFLLFFAFFVSQAAGVVVAKIPLFDKFLHTQTAKTKEITQQTNFKLINANFFPLTASNLIG